MATVCVDDNFEVDENGVLTLAKCGDPADQAWPYAANPTNNNGLRLDPGCGLWAPPDKIVSSYFASQTTALGVTLTNGGTTATSAPLLLSVANPSADFPMLLVLEMFNSWRFGQLNNTFTVARSGWSKDNASVPANEVASHVRAEASFTQQTGWIGTSTDIIKDVLNPGQVATYRLVTAMSHGITTGASEYIQTVEKLNGYGITITQ